MGAHASDRAIRRLNNGQTGESGSVRRQTNRNITVEGAFYTFRRFEPVFRKGIITEGEEEVGHGIDMRCVWC
jgi:hypothetical protein